MVKPFILTCSTNVPNQGILTEASPCWTAYSNSKRTTEYINLQSFFRLFRRKDLFLPFLLTCLFKKNERKTLLFRLQIPFFTLSRGILSLFFLHFMPIFSEKGRYVLPKMRRLFIHCPCILPTNLFSFASRSHYERLQYPFPLFLSLFLLRNSVLFRLTKSAFKRDITNGFSQKTQELFKSPIS